ncbi:MAG: hypothetical protein QM708_13570 [Propioniciclava sp.]|uniref:hypothetical protein n=1 Tax=Propioniciclava sp. TaxID=2038686 RepID=UPI0039E6093F
MIPHDQVRYARQVSRTATRTVSCLGGTVWCTQVITPRQPYTALLVDGRFVGAWCGECARVLGRSL